MVDACFSYYWHMDENETEITSIRIYGLDRSNKNVCLRIDDFIPYIYIELPPTDSRNVKIDWGNNVQMVKNRLDDILKEHKPLRTKLVYKHKLYGAEIDKDGNKKTFPYLMCYFSNKNDYKHLSYKIKDINIFGIGRLKLKVHEYDASPILQFVSSRDIPTAGWLKFKGERVKNEEKLTLCDKEYVVSYKNIAKYEKDNVGKPKLMGFDIEVNSTNPSAMPISSKQGDKIFQISCVFAREGSNESEYEPYLLSLGDPDPEIVGGNTKVLKFESEADLLEGFSKLVRTENPNIIVGYNILKFDIQYMIDRAKSPWTFNCFDTFAKMGFHKYNRASQEKIKWSSSAFKNQEFDFLNAEGRVFVDLLPLIQRDYKLNNYQLKTVSMEFLKDTKDDLSAKGIFKCYRLGIQKDEDGTYGNKARKAMAVCGKYCMKDSILVLKLMEKLQCWVGLCEMAKTTNIAIFDVFTQGQQRKVYSQLYKFCLYNNIVVEKDAYVTKENERYVGAHVFPPVPGNYERVLPFDFCFSGDTLITMSNGLSKRIDSFDKDKLLLAFNKEENCFENYSFINGLQRKGFRDTVKVYFQDGSSIIATPEHKFMLENGEWCQAKDLKDKYVKAGIKYPEDKDCSLEKEWKLEVEGYNFNMKDELEREKSLAFARMIGYILADGSIYETTCSRGYTRKCVEACFGTLFDALTFKRDINLFSDIDVTIRKRDGNGDEDREKKGTTQCITLPAKISYMIHSLEDIMVGKRSTQEIKLPKFILDDNCPLSIIREFLGGLFGGDGTAPCICKDKRFGYIEFKWTIIKKYFYSLENVINQISKLLLKFDIFSTINKPYNINYNENSIKPNDCEERIDLKLKIKNEHFNIFYDNLNFKYCSNKNYRLYISTLYEKYEIKFREQLELLIKNCKKINRITDKLLLEQINLLEKQECLVFKDGLLKLNKKFIKKYKNTKIRISNYNFPYPEQFIKDLNIQELFTEKYLIKTDDIILPSFRQKVIDVREHIPTEVFDIEVDKVHNYLANGITVSNCSLYPTTIIAYNIDYSTIVNDPAVPDDKCNIMEWSDHLACLVNGSIITSNGFGFKIENMKENNNLILSHSEKTNLLEYKKQTNFFVQGKKRCIELTFTDGSILRCTPDHRIMTSDNKWIEAKDIIINNTKIKKGISYPVTEFEKYLSDFEIEIGELKLNMKTIKNIERFCKFSRILGFLYTDGTIAKNRATVYVRDIVDAECMINDIYDICGEKIEYKFNYNGSSRLYYIRIPYSIHNSCIWNICDGYGRRSTKDSYLPTFILNERCPLIIKREFLSGMFGGDGVSPGYSTKTKNSLYSGLSASKVESKLDNLKEFFISIQNMLLNDFKIKSYINGPYHKDVENTFSYILKIDPNSQIKFYENIGYRYCTYKQIRCEILTSYRRLNNIVFDQRQKCFNMIYRFKDKMSWEDATKLSHKIMKYDIIFNEHYSLSNKYHAVDGLRRPRNGNKITFLSKHFPSFEQYIKDLGVFHLFVNNELDPKASSIYGKKQDSIDTIPYYLMKVVHIRDIGIQETFDLEIDINHSFIANSTVVHNCSHDPKVIRYNKLSKFIKDEEEELKKLRTQRDDKINKLFKQEYIDKINQKLVELKPYREERTEIKKSIPKNVMCEERKYRFLKEPKGVIPTVLQNLLDARKNTRKEIKNNYKEIDSMKEKLKDENINETEKEEIEKRIREMEDLNKVLDKRQLSYKVSANSMYGIMGVKKGLLPFMPGAMATTYMGRTNIEKVANTIVSNYGGKLVYGDTDSNYIHFPHLKTAEESWDYALKVASEISDMFPKPISLAFEEAIYWQFFILTKKRYMYRSCERDGVVNKKIGKKGVLLARRDSAVLIRNIYEKIISMIFDKVPRDDILYYLLEELNKMCSNSMPYRDYVITKSVGDVNNMVPSEPYKDEKGKIKVNIGNYKVPYLPSNEKEKQKQLENKEAENEKEYYEKCLPAVVQLAEKMRKRGQRVDVGTRLEYVITDIGYSGKQYEKLEHIDYFLNYNDILRIDFAYYIKLMINPIDDLLNVAFKKNIDNGYKFKKDFMNEQHEFRSKTREKVMNELKNLFRPKVILEK
jgi:DNA polymerase elongation subunit (family B)